ncbi:MAG: XRE family transcriptional regulator [Dehalococcoidia bacterium]|nr:XRE family transcriptional regulator [Dehalococcoidia bacterium]
MLALARESRGETQSGLARTIGITQGHISRIEAGQSPASDAIISDVVDALGYPEHFFFMDEPVYGPGVSEFFHRKHNTSTKVLNRMHANLNVRRIHVARLMAAAELNSENIPRLNPRDFGSPEAVARAIRSTWNLPPGPVEDLTSAVEDAGGIVLHCDFGTRDVDGVSRWIPGLPPMFFLNRDMPGDRMRLTLAHELGHVVMHRAPRPEMEEEAYSFGRELLMPEDEIRPHFQRVTVHSLAEMKPFWRVSMAALLYCAGELGAISERQRRTLYMQLGSRGFRRQEPPELDVPIEKPTLLQEIVQMHQNDLGYTVDELADLLALKTEEMLSLYDVTMTHEERRRRLRAVG